MGQFYHCLQSSEGMKNPIQIMQGKKLASTCSSSFVGILTTPGANM